MKLFSYRFSVRDDREPISFMLSIIAILQTKIMRRRFENNAKLYEYKIVSNCIGGG